MRRMRRIALLLAGGLVMAATGCGGGGSDAGDDPSPKPMDHTNIVLRDRYGAPITTASVEPYSPRATCGPCHDVDRMANAYHFQQGRTDASGAIVTKDDYFGDGRRWLLSAGMYGKW